MILEIFHVKRDLGSGCSHVADRSGWNGDEIGPFWGSPRPLTRRLGSKRAQAIGFAYFGARSGSIRFGALQPPIALQIVGNRREMDLRDGLGTLP